MALLDFLRRTTHRDTAVPYTMCARCRCQLIDDRHYTARTAEVASANYDATRAVTALRPSAGDRQNRDYDWGWR